MGNFLLSLVIWVIDYIVRVDLGFSIFYVLPVAIMAWCVSPKAAYLLCLFAAFQWFIAESARIPPYPVEFFLVWNTFVRLMFWLMVASLLAELKASYRQEQYLASTDFLTGLLNRRAFMAALAQEIMRSRRYGLTFTLVYFDVDNFKQVNDRLGHATGDRLLQTVATVLQQILRVTDFSSRLGGDEFTILMPQTDLPQAKNVLLRMFHELAQLSSKHEVSISFSIGAITFISAPESADEALAAADQLMYSIKLKGKNQVIQEVYGRPVGGDQPQ